MTFDQALAQLTELRRIQSMASRAGMAAGFLHHFAEVEHHYHAFRAAGDRVAAFEEQASGVFDDDEFARLRIRSMHLSYCEEERLLVLTPNQIHTGMPVEYTMAGVTYFGCVRAARSKRIKAWEQAWGEPALDLSLWPTPARKGRGFARFVRLSRFTLDADGVLRGTYA